MKNQYLPEGTWLVSLPGFTKDDYSCTDIGAGAGYSPDRMFQVKFLAHVDGKRPGSAIAFPMPDGNGIYFRALRLATPWEIKTGKVNSSPSNIIY